MFPDFEINNIFEKKLTEQEARLFSPLTLAFLGDAVYSLLVRDMLTKEVNRPTGALHKLSIQYVNAAFQAEMMHKILPMLTENETAVFKRGRNAHSAHSPKNQSDADYRYATGLEALYGYLYLCKDFERITYLYQNSTAEIHRSQEK